MTGYPLKKKRWIVCLQKFKEKLSKGTYVKWAIVFAVAIMLSFIPVNDVFTSQIRLFFIITITTILIVAI